MITIDDLLTRFNKDNELAELTDREHYENIDINVINTAIRDAEAEVETYLNTLGLVKRNRLGNLIYTYATTIPEALILKTCDIARYYLHDDQVTDVVQKRYDQAVKWFEKVQKNPAMLTGITEGVGNTEMANSGVFVMPNAVPSMWDN